MKQQTTKQQIQVTEIENGVLIGTQGSNPVQDVQGRIIQQGVSPTITYAANFEEMCSKLKSLFPPQLSGGE